MPQSRQPLIARIAEAAAARWLSRAPREFFLIAACCRWPASEAKAAAVRAAALGAIDWPRLRRLVRRHGVWGLVKNGLAEAGVAPPETFTTPFGATAAAMSRRNLANAAETARLHSLLRQAGISAVFVKGATLAALCYRNLVIKHSFDIDILVSPAQVELARAVLEQAGYAMAPPLPALTKAQLALLLKHSREWVFHHQNSRIVVELHWRLAYNDLLLKDWDTSAPLVTVKIGEAEVPTFSREHLFVYLCVHGAQHAWSRLKWLADLGALLALEDDADIEGLYRAAQDAGAGRCAGQALLLCERLLGVELPASLSTRLHSERIAPLLEVVAVDAMLAGDGEIAPQERSFRYARDFVSLFLIGEGARHMLREFARYMISPADVAAFPRLAQMTWLYVILRGPLWALRRCKEADRKSEG